MHSLRHFFIKRTYTAHFGFLVIIFIALIWTTFLLIGYERAVRGYNTLASDIQLQHIKNISILKQIRHDTARKKPEKVKAKAIYLTTYTAGNNIDPFIERILATELNAVVIDIKDYTGQIAYKTDDPFISELQTEKVIIENIEEVIQKLHENGIYAVARMQVFQDPALASRRPEWAIKNSTTGGTWEDYKGLAWMDPNNQNVWEYTVALAKDAIAKGFDEINLDYIRFPSDGPIGSAVYSYDVGRTKTETINAFFAYVSEQLSDEPAYLSADLFGMTMWHESDFNIGQTLAGAAPYFDYISPMVYPSHYPSGFLGLANPASHPYTIVESNLARGKTILAKASSTAEFRPWLQDFDLGAVYTADMVREQIKAAEEHDTHGWFLWNASNRYTYEALDKE